MLMAPRLPKEINSHTFFSSFAKNAFLIENYHHMLLDIFNILDRILFIYLFEEQHFLYYASVYSFSFEVKKKKTPIPDSPLFSAAKQLHAASQGKPIKLNDCLDVQLFFWTLQSSRRILRYLSSALTISWTWLFMKKVPDHRLLRGDQWENKIYSHGSDLSSVQSAYLNTFPWI